MPRDEALIHAIKNSATAVDTIKNLAPLINQIAQSNIVMLGESSHGTHEFYEWRRIISEKLIADHGFKFIAVEGDWPPCWALNRFIRGKTTQNVHQTLQHFDRWPTWMWANTDIVELAERLRDHNVKLSADEQIGFYGLDVYSLFESADIVLAQISKINPALARQMAQRYACFDPYERDERVYARSLINFPEGCEKQVLENLQDLLRLRLDKETQNDALFNAQQNARVVADAEHYYRAMIVGDEDTWNIRDRHMLDTLEILLQKFGPTAKGIVWAHNTHIGDYRATDMQKQGQINIGGLARQKWGESHVSLVGFGTYHGEVIASHAWDGPIEKMKVPPGMAQSYEAIFHQVAQQLQINAFFLDKLYHPKARANLAETRGHRAIGVVYHPAHERLGNYVPTSLANRYDAFIFIDRTTALTPLRQSFDPHEIPETWPGGH